MSEEATATATTAATQQPAHCNVNTASLASEFSASAVERALLHHQQSPRQPHHQQQQQQQHQQFNNHTSHRTLAQGGDSAALAHQQNGNQPSPLQLATFTVSVAVNSDGNGHFDPHQEQEDHTTVDIDILLNGEGGPQPQQSTNKPPLALLSKTMTRASPPVRLYRSLLTTHNGGPHNVTTPTQDDGDDDAETPSHKQSPTTLTSPIVLMKSSMRAALGASARGTKFNNSFLDRSRNFWLESAGASLRIGGGGGLFGGGPPLMCEVQEEPSLTSTPVIFSPGTEKPGTGLGEDAPPQPGPALTDHISSTFHSQHTWHHVERVENMADVLATEEGDESASSFLGKGRQGSVFKAYLRPQHQHQHQHEPMPVAVKQYDLLATQDHSPIKMELLVNELIVDRYWSRIPAWQKPPDDPNADRNNALHGCDDVFGCSSDEDAAEEDPPTKSALNLPIIDDSDNECPTAGGVPLLLQFQTFRTRGVGFSVSQLMTGDLLTFVVPQQQHQGGGVLSMAQLRSVARQLLQGLAMLESVGVVHRDLKASNVLYDAATGEVKIADFGCALHATAATTAANHAQQGPEFVGTLTSMSPERLRNEPYSFNSDVWAVGLIIASLAIGEHPLRLMLGDAVFTASADEKFWPMMGLMADDTDSGSPRSLPSAPTFHQQLPSLFEQRLSSDSTEETSALLRFLVDGCFVIDPTNRPNAETLLQLSQCESSPSSWLSAKRGVDASFYLR